MTESSLYSSDSERRGFGFRTAGSDRLMQTRARFQTGLFQEWLQAGFLGGQWFDDRGIADFESSFQPGPRASHVAQLSVGAGEIVGNPPVLREFSGPCQQYSPRLLEQPQLLLRKGVVNPADGFTRQ